MKNPKLLFGHQETKKNKHWISYRSNQLVKFLIQNSEKRIDERRFSIFTFLEILSKSKQKISQGTKLGAKNFYHNSKISN